MKFSPPLQKATLLRRYKRFLADCRLDNGTEITAHCATPGSMMGLAAPGTRGWLEPNDDPKKKLKWAWRLVEFGNGHWAGIDTAVPNRVVREALAARARVQASQGKLAEAEAALAEAGFERYRGWMKFVRGAGGDAEHPSRPPRPSLLSMGSV